MPSPRKAISFIALAVVIATLLLLPALNLDHGYASAFRPVADVLFGSMGGDGFVRFEPESQSASGMDSTMILGNRGTGAQARAPLSIRLIGFVPTAIVLALCLATPTTWRRRLAILATALAATQIFVAFRVLLRLAEIFSAGDTLTVYEPSPALRSLIVGVSQLLSVSLLGSFVVPVLIWAAIGLRPSDWHNSNARTTTGHSNPKCLPRHNLRDHGTPGEGQKQRTGRDSNPR